MKQGKRFHQQVQALDWNHIGTGEQADGIPFCRWVQAVVRNTKIGHLVMIILLGRKML